MTGVRYVPGGDWVTVVRAGVVVLVPASTAPEVLDLLWNQLGEKPDLQSVLPIVAGGFGQGLDSMPPFGVVSYSNRLHVLLRGEVRLSVVAKDGAAPPVELTGEHVTTWTERIFDDGAEHFTLSAGADAAPQPGRGFPLQAGVVQASAVGVGVSIAGVSGAGVSDDGVSGDGTTRTVTPAPPPAAVTGPVAAQPPAPAPAPAPVMVTAGEGPDPERAMTGAVEAEELATINPSLYLTSTDQASTDDDGGAAVDARTAGVDAGAGPGVSDQGAGPKAGPDATPEPQTADPESQTTGYDHLWDQTVMRRVEDAAMRPREEAGDSDAAAPLGPDAATSEHADTAGTGSGGTASTDAASTDAAPSGPAPADPTPPLTAPGQLIDSVPWARRSPGSEQTAAGTLTPAPVIPAPVTPTPAPAPVTTADKSALDDDEDHDGQTIMRSELSGAAFPSPVQPSEARPGTGPLVLARLCAQGHANPPEAPECGVCSQLVDGEPREVRRPSLGTVRISTGEVVELDQSLVIGRQPSVSRVQGKGMPKLVQVTSAGGDISRSHVEVRLDGWHVLLCDLKATNGTVLIRPGQPPRRLGEGETAFVLDGDVAQLGDDVFLRFEGLR